MTKQQKFEAAMLSFLQTAGGKEVGVTDPVTGAPPVPSPSDAHPAPANTASEDTGVTSANDGGLKVCIAYYI